LSRKFNRQLTMFSQNFTKKTITLSSSWTNYSCWKPCTYKLRPTPKISLLGLLVKMFWV
jgi:hypothetical protein